MSGKTKTPISNLQEFCQKESINSPDYSCKPSEKMNHTPQFEFTCSIILKDGTTFSETGLGPSKKEAKHKSANNVLLAIHEHMSCHKDAVTSGYFDNASNISATFGTIPANSVVQLEDYCKEKHLPPPNITTREDTDGSGYYAECSIEHIRTEATLPSKKTAKRKVAELMLKKLEEIGDEKLQKKLNELSSMVSVLNDKNPIRHRHTLANRNIDEVICHRPEHCKLVGRLQENFEDLATSDDLATNTFAPKIIKFLKKLELSRNFTDEEVFEEFVKICDQNSIPVRETVKKEAENRVKNSSEKGSEAEAAENEQIDENSQEIEEIHKFTGYYLISVHFDKPLTFFGFDLSLQQAKKMARSKCLKYIGLHFKQLLAFNQAEEAKNVKKETKKEDRRARRGYR